MNLYFNLPFDPTGYASISGAQLAQLVGGLGPATGYGFCIVSVDDAFGVPNVPNPNTIAALSSFLWLRIGNTSNASAGLYIWNPNGANSATLLKWQLANISSITAGSITGSQIAANTITDNNIFSVGWNKLPSGGAVGGVLVGNMPNPGLANDTVGGSSLVDNSVGGTKLIFGTAYQVYMTNAAGNAIGLITDYFAALSSTGLGTAYQSPQVNSIGSAIVWITDFFAKLIGVSGIGTAKQAARVNAGATALEWYSDAFADLITAGIGTAHQVARVNSGATALEWATVNSSPFGTLVSISDPNNTGLPADDTPTVIPHTLGAIPTYVRVVVKCLTGTGGYSTGEEVELYSFTGSNGTFRVCPFSVSSDATNITIGVNGGTDSTQLSVLTKAGSTYTNIGSGRANWQLKVYAAL